MRTITVEEHYATAAFMDGPGRQLAALADSVREHPQVAAGYELLIKQLCDLGDGRIAAALLTPLLDALRRKIGHQPAPGSRAMSPATSDAAVRVRIAASSRSQGCGRDSIHSMTTERGLKK